MDIKIYQTFADILEYPSLLLLEKARECLASLVSCHGPAANLMKEFAFFLEQTPLSQMEEIYTRTFDLQAICIPYVGYHLFGEDHRRAMFMAELKKCFRRNNFSPGNELPDHLGVLLRFLARENDPGEREELIQMCLRPALFQMVQSFGEENHPYRAVLQALLLMFQEKPGPKVDLGTPTIKMGGLPYGR